MVNSNKHPVLRTGGRGGRIKIPYFGAQVQIITNVHLRVQLELETNLKKRKTSVFTCPTKLTWLELFVFIFYLFSKSPDPIKHPPKSFYFYKVLLHSIFKDKLISKGVLFRKSSIILSLKNNYTDGQHNFFSFSIVIPQICIFSLVV